MAWFVPSGEPNRLPELPKLPKLENPKPFGLQRKGDRGGESSVWAVANRLMKRRSSLHPWQFWQYWQFHGPACTTKKDLDDIPSRP
jgi:hypothetical protein